MRITLRVEEKTEDGQWVGEDKMIDAAQLMNMWDRTYLQKEAGRLIDNVMKQVLAHNSKMRKEQTP